MHTDSLVIRTHLARNTKHDGRTRTEWEDEARTYN